MTDYESKPPAVGLWANTNERGPVASGNCGNIRFVLWKNTKGGPNAPDYRLVLEQAQKRESGSHSGDSASGQSDTRQDDRGAQGGGRLPEDEIPF